MEALAESSPQLEKDLRRIAFEAISRLGDRVVTVGRRSAVEKVGAFLIEMAECASHGSGDRFSLPLSRHDIADYLGLSMETVSRSISELRRRAAISLVGPHRGFETDSVRVGGLGLSGMADRMRSVGGTLRIESAPGLGATITASVPLSATDPGRASRPVTAS